MDDISISIFGGVFTWPAAKQRYLAFEEEFEEPLKESFGTLALGLKIKGWSDSSDYRYGWANELERFSEALERRIAALSDVLGIPSCDRSGLDEIRQAAFRQIAKDGHQFEEAISASIYSGEHPGVIAAQIQKGGAFVTLEISCAVDLVVGLVSEWLNSHGYELCKINLSADAEKAKMVFDKLKNNQIRDEKIDEAKLLALQLDPFNQSFLEWCWERAEDKGPINQVACEMGVSLDDVQKAAFVKAVGSKTLGDEEQAKAYLVRVKEAADRYGYDASTEKRAAEEAIRRYDEQARSAGGRLFPTREEAKIQRKLVAYAQSADLSSEESAKKALVDIANYAKTLGVDGTWQLEPVKALLKKMDEEARSAGGRLFTTREEAEKQRELVALEKTFDLSNEESALEARDRLEKLTAELKIDGAWKLKRVEEALRKFDEAARTAYGKIYKTRQAARAAKNSPKVFAEIVEQIIEGVGEAAFYHGDSLPPKKVLGARSYLTNEQDTGLFALLDTTVFGSAKCGMSMTEWGIVWKNDDDSISTRTSYAWHEFGELHGAFKQDGTTIRFADDAVYDNCGSNVNTEKVLAVLKKVCSLAAETTFSTKGNAVTRKTSKHSASKKSGVPKAVVVVADIVAAFGKIKNSNIFVLDTIPNKKKGNAFVSMKVLEPISTIAALVDATVFGSAKDGMVITDKAVYFKNFMEDPVRIAFDELKKVAVKGKSICLNDQMFTPCIFEEDEIAAIGKALKPKKPKTATRKPTGKKSEK